MVLQGTVENVPFNIPVRGDRNRAPDGKEMRVFLSLCEQYECCSATCSGFGNIPQMLFRCFTCTMDNCCAVCVRHCHRGHDIGPGVVSFTFCVCGTSTPHGCARRLSLVMLVPENKREIILSSAAVRPRLLQDIDRDELKCIPFRRTLYHKHDQQLHLHLRLRMFTWRNDRPRLELVPEVSKCTYDLSATDDETFKQDPNNKEVLQTDEVDDERAVSLNVGAVKLGRYKLVLRKREHEPLEFGTVLANLFHF
jgi:hypothetical protein